MDGQYNRMVWCINTRTIPRCFGKTKMASNNENGIGPLVNDDENPIICTFACQPSIYLVTWSYFGTLPIRRGPSALKMKKNLSYIRKRIFGVRCRTRTITTLLAV